MANYFVAGGTGNDTNSGTSEGAAWATLGKAASTATDGDIVHVKAGTTYTLTTTVTWGAGVSVVGYTTNPGSDDGRPLVTSSTNGLNLFAVNGDRVNFRHLRITHTGSTRGSGIYAAGSNRFLCVFSSLEIDGCLIGINGEYTSFYAFMNLTVDNCSIINCVGSGVACASLTLSNAKLRGNGGPAVRRGNYNAGTQSILLYQVEISNTTGAGVSWDANFSGTLSMANTTIVGSSSHGVSLPSPSANTVAMGIQNCIFDSNGGFGLSAANAQPLASSKNAFRANTSGDRSTTLGGGVGDFSLSANPFVNSGTGDYKLNSVSGGGAACKSVGTSVFGSTPTLDVGCHQSSPSTGGGGVSRSRVINVGGI